MSRNTIIILVVVLVVIVIPALIATAIGVAMLLGRNTSSFSLGGKQVALIRVEGVITSDRGSSGLFGGSSAGAERIIDILEDFRKDDGVKSAVIRINSPGGSAAGSQEVYQEIQKVRKDGKKITVSMGDVAASGGYYIASAADRIMADQATMTGSIGVIMHASDMHELYNKIGIRFDTIKTGQFKDIGSNTRPMTPQEKQLLQNLVNDVFEQFIADVSAGRKLPVADVRKIADGRIFTGRQALRLKLVDKLGSLEDALDIAAKDAGIKGDYDIVEYEHQKGFWDMLTGGSDSSLSGWLRDSGVLSQVAQRVLTGTGSLQMR
jgi:protease IV